MALDDSPVPSNQSHKTQSSFRLASAWEERTGTSRPFSGALSCFGLDLTRQASRVLSTPCARFFLNATWLSLKRTYEPQANRRMVEKALRSGLSSGHGAESPGRGTWSLRAGEAKVVVGRHQFPCQEETIFQYSFWKSWAPEYPQRRKPPCTLIQQKRT